MITGIILASGFSNRMRKNKLMMKLNNMSIIEMVINNAKNSKLDDLILVYRSSALLKFTLDIDIRLVYNDKAYLGQSESIKLGVLNASKNSDYLFLLGDQPFITSGILDKIIDEHNSNKEKIIVPYYNEKRGNPVLFPNKFRNELLSLSGDEGARNIIYRYKDEIKKLCFKNSMYNIDIDNIEDYEKAKKLLYNFNNEDRE
ncbi:nucleotidyltransferase family protein [Soehngenia saccharolytica]|nr:nucleotidyltransferase family protein [Soehngenia saccharolytica]